MRLEIECENKSYNATNWQINGISKIESNNIRFRFSVVIPHYQRKWAKLLDLRINEVLVILLPAYKDE